MQIFSILSAYKRDDVLKAIGLYQGDVDVKQKLTADGWITQQSHPENKEFYYIDGKYWVQSDEARATQIKSTVKALKEKQIQSQKPGKKKQNMDLKQVSIPCPKCQGKMYKQNVCGGCAAGKAGYKIRLICEDNPDHEVLL